MIKLAFVPVAVMTAFLSGCSWMQVGENDYSCPGMPGDALCKSSRDIYSATDDGNVPLPMDPSGEGREGKHEGHAESREQKLSGRSENPQDVVSTFVSPRLPDQPVPVRTPAQVMRVWLAPWEDDTGDLVVSGYIYTEIQPRRWVIGEEAPTAAPRLKALSPVSSGSNTSNTSSTNSTSSHGTEQKPGISNETKRTERLQ